MLEYDVAVVGGGPIGGYVAGEIAREKFKVAIFEKHKEIGTPINCAGLVSQRVFDITNVNPQAVIQNKVKGAHIHSPSGNLLTIGGDKDHALVIDRSEFDKNIIKRSETDGAEVLADMILNI